MPNADPFKVSKHTLDLSDTVAQESSAVLKDIEIIGFKNMTFQKVTVKIDKPTFEFGVKFKVPEVKFSFVSMSKQLSGKLRGSLKDLTVKFKCKGTILKKKGIEHLSILDAVVDLDIKGLEVDLSKVEESGFSKIIKLRTFKLF